MNIFLTYTDENRRTSLPFSGCRPVFARALRRASRRPLQSSSFPDWRPPRRQPSGHLPRSGVTWSSVFRHPSSFWSGLSSRLRQSASPGKPASSSVPVRSGVRRLASGVCLRSAFTLIELLVVMVLVVVIMAISLPSFISIGRGAGMRTAVNNVRSTLSLTRQWTITHREQITFVASSAGMSWTTNNTIQIETNNHACYYATNAEGNLIQSVTDLPLDVTFEGADPPITLTFKTDGGLTALIVNPLVLVDKRDHHKRRIISINGLTGGIRVE